MSNLATAEGDDFPEAAAKHLDDADALLSAGRSDGAGYLTGYVLECSFKTVIVLDAVAKRVRLGPRTTLVDVLSSPDAGVEADVKAGTAEGSTAARKLKHDLGKLSAEAQRLAKLASTAVAKYDTSGVNMRSSVLNTGGWRETLRYRAVGSIDKAKASSWFDDAKAVYLTTVGAMKRDGVLFNA
jgi:hypothetical protein